MEIQCKYSTQSTPNGKWHNVKQVSWEIIFRNENVVFFFRRGLCFLFIISLFFHLFVKSVYTFCVYIVFNTNPFCTVHIFNTFFQLFCWKKNVHMTLLSLLILNSSHFPCHLAQTIINGQQIFDAIFKNISLSLLIQLKHSSVAQKNVVNKLELRRDKKNNFIHEWISFVSFNYLSFEIKLHEENVIHIKWNSFIQSESHNILNRTLTTHLMKKLTRTIRLFHH